MGSLFSINERQKDLNERYEEQHEEIRGLARKFRALLMKLRNMCSSRERIVRDIKTMCKQLIKQLEKTQKVDREIRELSQDVIAAKTEAQRRYNDSYEEKRALTKKLDTLKRNQRDAENKKRELQQEQTDEENKLEELKRENRRLNENANDALITSIASGVTGVACAIGGLIFPPLEVPAFILLGGAGTVQVGTLTAAIIMKNMETSEEKLQSLRENITRLDGEIDQLADEIHSQESEVNEKNSQLSGVEQILEEATARMDECTRLQNNTNSWLSTLNDWLSFLIEITPEAERVEGHLGNNERAFQRAIEDFTKKINGASELEEKSRLLAINN